MHDADLWSSPAGTVGAALGSPMEVFLNGGAPRTSYGAPPPSAEPLGGNGYSYEGPGDLRAEASDMAMMEEVDPIAALAANLPGGGVPGEDFPILASVPDTGFSCQDQDLPGYYADLAEEAGCQVFHICQFDGRQDSFLCPNGTIFNQQYFVCDWWFNVDCQANAQFFGLNAEIGRVLETQESVRSEVTEQLLSQSVAGEGSVDAVTDIPLSDGEGLVDPNNLYGLPRQDALVALDDFMVTEEPVVTTEAVLLQEAVFVQAAAEPAPVARLYGLPQRRRFRLF